MCRENVCGLLASGLLGWNGSIEVRVNCAIIQPVTQIYSSSHPLWIENVYIKFFKESTFLSWVTGLSRHQGPTGRFCFNIGGFGSGIEKSQACSGPLKVLKYPIGCFQAPYLFSFGYFGVYPLFAFTWNIGHAQLIALELRQFQCSNIFQHTPPLGSVLLQYSLKLKGR